MKITIFSLSVFLDEVKALERKRPALEEAAQAWLAMQKQRQDYGSVDGLKLQGVRMKLEDELMEYRQALANVYDFMGDKGLVNFVPTGVAAPEQRMIIE